jgi:hypothetical protein
MRDGNHRNITNSLLHFIFNLNMTSLTIVIESNRHVFKTSGPDINQK